MRQQRNLDAGLRGDRLRMLVNNAGIFIASPFTDYAEYQYRQELRANLDGFPITAQEAIR